MTSILLITLLAVVGAGALLFFSTKIKRWVTNKLGK